MKDNFDNITTDIYSFDVKLISDYGYDQYLIYALEVT